MVDHTCENKILVDVNICKTNIQNNNVDNYEFTISIVKYLSIFLKEDDIYITRTIFHRP